MNKPKPSTGNITEEDIEILVSCFENEMFHDPCFYRAIERFGNDLEEELFVKQTRWK